jgi:hypothetical protein
MEPKKIQAIGATLLGALEATLYASDLQNTWSGQMLPLAQCPSGLIPASLKTRTADRSNRAGARASRRKICGGGSAGPNGNRRTLSNMLPGLSGGT